MESDDEDDDDDDDEVIFYLFPYSRYISIRTISEVVFINY